jgi:hypothetical protein
MVEVPTVAVEATVIVIVEVPEPGAAIDDGLKETVTPEGAPEADSAMALLKPPEIAVVMVELPAAPWAIETALGEAEIEKSGVGVPPVGVTDTQVLGAEAQASLPLGSAVTW